MKKVTIRQSSENVVYVTLNGKVIYIDDSIKGELTIDAWDEETEELHRERDLVVEVGDARGAVHRGRGHRFERGQLLRARSAR